MTKKSNTKTWLWISLLLLGALLVSGSYYFWSLQKGWQEVSPKMGPLVEAVYGLGTVIAPQTYQVKTAVNQSIQKIFVKEGDQVKAGDPLVQLDEGGITKAPFAGTVSSIAFKQGELVFPQVPVLTLVNLQGLYLEASLEQQLILRVRPGQTAVVSFESLRNERLTGTVQAVFPRENQFLIRVALEKFPTGVLPGMTADIAIEVGRREQVLMVPVRAITSGKITLIKDGHKKKVPIQIGIVDGEWAEVTSGNIGLEDHVLVRSP